MEEAYNVAGIDVHKKMLAVVVANARDTELQFGSGWGSAFFGSSKKINVVSALTLVPQRDPGPSLSEATTSPQGPVAMIGFSR